jgi:hypothetical protein
MRTHSLFLFAAAPLFAAILFVAAGGAWASITCSGAIRHPIEARVVALDPIRRGNVVRFEVVASSQVDLRRPWARVVPNGGVRVVGPAHVELAPRAGHAHERSATFRVVVPNAGHRQLLQFRIEGEGPAGILTRGVAFNLMPDGPVETLRPAQAGNGDALLEASAGRVDR